VDAGQIASVSQERERTTVSARTASAASSQSAEMLTVSAVMTVNVLWETASVE